MAPISSTCACRHVSWRKRGAKHRIPAAKRAGRRSMAAVLWPGRASLAAHPLRRPTLQARTSASDPAKLAKLELRLYEDCSRGDGPMAEVHDLVKVHGRQGVLQFDAFER